MKYSKLFPKTQKVASSEAKNNSYKLLYRAGFIRESSAGRYYMLSLGLRVQQKIVNIIKKEMDSAGAQEILSPVLHPLELWKETNRTNSAGFELMMIEDRHGASFALGGTGEEMFVDLMRKFQISYKDLPINLYQFSLKFRDELRVRGGLLRVREFMMKDAYSFHVTRDDFEKEYKKMWELYTKVFDKMGLKTVVIKADNGYIGGEYCHEFVVESPVGESKFLVTEDGKYAEHEDVAQFIIPEIESSEKERPLEEVEGRGIIGVEKLAKYLNIPVEMTTKTILFEDEKGNVIAASVRGEYDINETKLMRIANVHSLNLASPEIVKKVTGAEVGYAGILNLPKNVRIFIDESMKGRKNFEMGANRTNYHTINVNFGRDLDEPKEFYDFKLAKDGYVAPNGKKLIAKKGIEVGNIFQLGYHYTNLMKGSVFVDSDGKERPYYMGCYGIGIGRTLASIVEMHNDERGISWPESVAPFMVHIVGLDLGDTEVSKKAESVYSRLIESGIEVLFDDRVSVSAGEKFADADLIGIPYRLVVSKKTQDKLEVKRRDEKESEMVSLEEFIKRVVSQKK